VLRHACHPALCLSEKPENRLRREAPRTREAAGTLKWTFQTLKWTFQMTHPAVPPRIRARVGVPWRSMEKFAAVLWLSAEGDQG
jgi:hypothetical protein